MKKTVLNSKEDLEGQIATLLGGAASAEENRVLVKSHHRAANDLQRATDIPKTDGAAPTGNERTRLAPGLRQTGLANRFLWRRPNPRRSVSDATGPGGSQGGARAWWTGP